jgi:hypothetical protein
MDWKNWFGEIMRPNSKLIEDARYEAKEAHRSIRQMLNSSAYDDLDAQTERELSENAQMAAGAIILMNGVIEHYDVVLESAENQIKQLKEVIDFALKCCEAFEISDIEVLNWCEENIKGKWFWHRYEFQLSKHTVGRKWIVIFLEDKDKLLFKMRWN